PPDKKGGKVEILASKCNITVPIRYLDNGKSELHYQYVQYREKHPKSEHWRTCVLFVDIP
ncbi:hypothetical protein, partial [Escherichia coli]|uniref:hypothetical protein n=1 Tax=Escherichia coli TaxID=562 RepID=UPI001A8C6390